MSGETNGNLKAAMFYRTVAGVFGAILITMLAYFGNQLLTNVADLGDAIGGLRSEVFAVKADLARYNGEHETDSKRLDRTNERQTDLDRRVTIIETRMMK